jgi:hypothetical protein
MTAVILRFPIERVLARHRAEPRPRFDRVRVLPGDDGEHWAIAGSFGWLHATWAEAVNDAVGLASDYGISVAVEVRHA